MTIKFTTGNLFDSGADALVNTVNTHGVMGKGIALMFKERFPENFKIYEAACKVNSVVVGRMFVTKNPKMFGPKWIINFPTKKNWRHPSKIEWIEQGLVDLKRVLLETGVLSVAIPPLGAGNGGLDWSSVKLRIEQVLADVPNIEIVVFEPTAQYQNVAKRKGVEKLTPSRALIAELVRRYSILGLDCSFLEVQKLAYLLEREILNSGADNPLDLRFVAHRYGPYSERLRHLLEGLDGSYLHSDKRVADASPYDIVRFDDEKRSRVSAYLTSPEASVYSSALDAASKAIDGYQSPLGLELLATVQWLLDNEKIKPTVESVRDGISRWPGGEDAAKRKSKLFDDRLIEL